MPDQLKTVRQVQANHDAFAAIRSAGFVVTWGAPHHGGDSSVAQDQLKIVRRFCCHCWRWIRRDLAGGDGQEPLGEQEKEQETPCFLELRPRTEAPLRMRLGWRISLLFNWGSRREPRSSKHVAGTTWGDAHCGGGSGAVQELLKNVQPTASLLLLCVVTGPWSPVVILTVVVTVVLCRVSCESRSRSRAPGGVAESAEVSVQ